MAASVAALAVSACVDPVKPIQAWSTATASQASVETVNITNASSNASPESLAALKTALDAALAQCARGPTKYEMQVRVDNFKLGNPALAILVGNSHEISAEVKIVNPENQAVASEYYVQERLGGGGIIGAAILASGAPGVSREFASSVCQKVFKKK
jgi:hypothetical protein